VWQHAAHQGLPRAKRHEKASQSNSTPATDGKYVAAIFGSEGLFVYTFDGKLLWKKDLGLLDPGLANDPTSQWGYASSPVIHDKLVIVQCDKHADSFLAAYDLSTGKEVWRTNRPDELPSWSTPTIYKTKERFELVTNGQFFRGYDVNTGKEIWRFADKAEVKQPTPIIADGSIFLTGGYPRGRPIYALRAGAKGDISVKQGESNQWVLWKTDRGGPYTPTPIVYRGHLYSVQYNGVLTCYDAKTGQQKYETKLQGDFSASPIANDGKLYFASESGDVSVVKAGSNFQLLQSNNMGSPCYGTPAISNSTLFIRTLNHLYAISGK
jgi:outer membrane protein assembly factor BamB